MATEYFIGGDKRGEYGALASALYGDNGKSRISLENLDAGPRLDLYDASGGLRAALGTTSTKNIETGTTETRPESSLVLFKENGRVLWETP